MRKHERLLGFCFQQNEAYSSWRRVCKGSK